MRTLGGIAFMAIPFFMLCVLVKAFMQYKVC